MAASPSSAHAQTPSSTGIRSHPAGPPRVEFIAVSSNDALLEQVGQALDGQSTIRQVDAVDAARELIQAAPCCVVLLDVPSGANAAQLVAQLHAPADLSVIVVFAPADQTAVVARSITATAAFAVLPVPIEVPKTAAVLEGARDEALSRHTLLRQRDEAGAEPVARPSRPSFDATPARVVSDDAATEPVANISRRRPHTKDDSAALAIEPAEPTGGGRKTLLIGVCAALALVAAGAGWYLTRDRATPATVTRTPATDAVAPATDAPASSLDHAVDPATVELPTSTEIKTGAIEDLLDLARTAFSERRYTDPKAESALVYYRSVLAQEPDNGEAREGLGRIAVVLDERLKAALDSSRYDDASLVVAQLKLAGADPARLKDASARIATAQISAAMARDNLERAAALLRQAEANGALGGEQAARFHAELDRQQADGRVKRLAGLADTRIRQGQLVEPPEDSAQFYVAQLRKLPNGAGAANAAQRNLEEAVLDQARAAGLRRQNDELERWLSEARKLGVNNSRIAAVRRDVRPQVAAPAAPVVSEVDRLASLVQTRLGEGRLVDPVQDSALFYLGQLRTADVAGARYATSARNVSDRLLQRGREAVGEKKPDLAQSMAAAARPIAADPAEVDALESEIARLRTPTTPRISPEKLKRTRYVAPEYPRDAMLRNTEGSVRVRIRVGSDGNVADATIVESNPARTFDRAALNAVRRWRFEPLTDASGKPAEAILETTVVFKIDAADR